MSNKDGRFTDLRSVEVSFLTVDESRLSNSLLILIIIFITTYYINTEIIWNNDPQ